MPALPRVAAARIRIALIEDNRLVRESLRALINQQVGLEVVLAQASDESPPKSAEAPHVVLIDIGVQRSDSLRTAMRIRGQYPEAKLIVMDLHPGRDDIVEYVNAGIAGFIIKDASLEEFVATIRTVAGGESVLPLRLVNALFSQIARDAVTPQRAELAESVRLTPREQQVITLISEGLSNKEIASRLQIAVHTVKSHVRNVMEKLTLHSRLQVAAYAHAQVRT